MKKALPYILPFVIGLALLPIPLLRDFHFESAMLAAIIGCFWGGIKASKAPVSSDFFSSLRILGTLYIAGIPLLANALFTGCLTIDGLGFWLLIPLPSVFFGTAVGRLIRTFNIPFPTAFTLLILLFCGIGVFIYELLNFPQVYFYNHVWGLWPGPIYDETVQLTGSFFYFRWLTFLWIILLWIIPNWSKNFQTKIITLCTLLSLLLSYMNLDEAGIISPRESIQNRLGGHHQSAHFDIYYDENFYEDQEIDYWASKHEFYFHQITTILNIDWPNGRKIESYLYAHAWQKKEITGAKFTSYVPIWLKQDQLHIAKQQLEDVLKHELVHVISKQFGNQLFNGSWSIGLIEGLAEAIAKDASPRSTLHQIVAAEQSYPSSDEMKSALSFWGFYKSAGAISYTTSGSFVEYLLNNYQAESLKQAYPTGNIENAYSASFEELISGWHQTLLMTPLDSVDQQISEYIFAQRSLFHKTCPHSVSQEMQLWDKYQFRLANYDTTAAYYTLDELYARNDQNDLVKSTWVRSQLLRGNFEQASEAITPKDTLLTLSVLKADALYLSGNHREARGLLQQIRADILSSIAPTFRFTLELRQDSIQWSYHVKRRYLGQFPDSTDFSKMNLPNQMLSLNKALQDNRDSLAVLYANILQSHTPNAHWFDIYERTIDKLTFLGYTNLAETWIALASESKLRLRYSERLHQQREWLEFVKYQSSFAD